MLCQIYDKAGTTHFQFTYVERKSEWHVRFSQGSISIKEKFKHKRIKVNFPEADHWTYEQHQSHLCDGVFYRGADIKNRHFTFSVSVHEYLDPDCRDEGFINLDTETVKTSMAVPYTLALNLMKFMNGSTDLLDVQDIRKINLTKVLHERVIAAQCEYDRSVTNYEQRLQRAAAGECSWREAEAACTEQGRTAEVYVNLEKELLTATIMEATAVIARAAASKISGHA